MQDSSGIFWDNDSLAGLLALELKADLLLLLSDVEGLYSGPPGEPDSKVIHTYIKEVHETKITFGDKSRVGRGGMIAKVKAAACAASAGIPVVISRFALSLSLLLSLSLFSPYSISHCVCFMSLSLMFFPCFALVLFPVYLCVSRCPCFILPPLSPQEPTCKDIFKICPFCFPCRWVFISS